MGEVVEVDWGTGGLEVSGGGGSPEHQSLGPLLSLHHHRYCGIQSLSGGWEVRV